MRIRQNFNFSENFAYKLMKDPLTVNVTNTVWKGERRMRCSPMNLSIPNGMKLKLKRAKPARK